MQEKKTLNLIKSENTINSRRNDISRNAKKNIIINRIKISECLEQTAMCRRECENGVFCTDR